MTEMEADKHLDGRHAIEEAMSMFFLFSFIFVAESLQSPRAHAKLPEMQEGVYQGTWGTSLFHSLFSARLDYLC